MSSHGATHPDRRQAAAHLRLVGLGAVIGIPAALVAAVFLALVHWLEHALWTELPERLGVGEPPWYLVVGLPLAGAVVVVLARRLLPGDGGHSPLDGIQTAPTPWHYAPGIALAALGTLAFGAVLGPEGPLIALGGTVGMVVVSIVKAEGPAKNVLSTAGSFSAVSALFGGPLVAGMLLLEGGLAAGAALLPALLPGLTAAAVGYVLFIGVRSWPGLEAPGLSVPHLPAYDVRLVDLLLAIVVGVAATVVVGEVKRVAVAIDTSTRSRSDRVTNAALILGGLAVGLLAQAAVWLGADSDQILFSGQAAVPSVLAETSVAMLALLVVAKAVAYAICLGCGFRGGPVFPAIFIGVALATVGCVWFGCSITWALAVGAAAGMTASTGLVFSAMLFAMLLTGGPGLDALPAAVLAAVAAWLTTGVLAARRNPPADA